MYAGRLCGYHGVCEQCYDAYITTIEQHNQNNNAQSVQAMHSASIAAPSPSTMHSVGDLLPMQCMPATFLLAMFSVCYVVLMKRKAIGISGCRVLFHYTCTAYIVSATFRCSLVFHTFMSLVHITCPPAEPAKHRSGFVR